MGSMISDVIEDHSFTFSFQTWDNSNMDAGTASALTHSMSMDASKYFSDPNAARTIDANEHKFVVTMHCLASSLDGNGGQLMAPPAMGDDIHFSYTIAGGSSPANSDHRLSAWFSHVTATSFQFEKKRPLFYQIPIIMYFYVFSLLT